MLPPVQGPVTPPLKRAYSSAAPGPQDSFQASEPSLLKAADLRALFHRRPTQFAVDFVNAYNRDLNVGPEAQKERDANMRKSPATFFRMFPALFHADMRGAYSHQLLDRPAPQLVINGDSHLGNFGTLRDDDEGLKWALNDYDQSGLGSPERDLARLATSIVLLGQESGLSTEESVQMAERFAARYCAEIARSEPKSAGMGQQTAYGPVKELIEKAKSKTHEQMVEKFAAPGPDGRWQLKRNDELVDVPAGLTQAIGQGVRAYEESLEPTPGIGRPLQILDVCRKLGSGGSSRGLDRYYVLLGGVPQDPLPAILELKQILPCPIDNPSGDLSLAQPGQVVANQDAMGGPENPLNGSVWVAGKEILAREREGEKLDLKLEKLTKKGWEATVEQAGAVLAQAHAHGHREALQEWIGGDAALLQQRLTNLSREYAAQTQADFAALA
jgi:uncharacterized protein (DUF2252 family)